MSKFKPGTSLYLKHDKLGVIEVKPGTEAEYHQLRLQGYSEKAPARKPVEPAPAATTGAKK